MMKWLKRCYLGIILVFLYVPILVLIVQSFNAGKSRAKWEGFSFRWYIELFKDERILNALYVTLSIAVLAMIAATLLGTLAAIGIHAMKKRPQAMMMTLTNLPNTMPDIVTGISLMLLFIFTKVERGYVTML
ncbi:MAG: ABC transporter permease, partial [Aristaeellaceae bacterium]